MKTRIWRWMAVVSLLVGLLPVLPARAALDSCTVSIAPSSVAPGSDTDFSVGLYNPSSNPITWMRVTRPPGNYMTLEDGLAGGGWQGAVATDTVTFTNGSLSHGSSQGFDVRALAANTTAGPMNWTVEASDDSGGAGAITCTGDVSLTIMTQPSQINISNVNVKNVGTDRVTVTWDTDVASTSKVEYGADSNYGQSTATNASLVTSHSMLVTGLSANTAYHYRVTSTTPADGGTASSGDGTFLTADVGAIQAGGSTTPAGGTSSGTVTPLIGKPVESVPPSITLTSRIEKAYKTAPRLEGEASDNEAVSKVEYSIDGGKNWSAVDTVTVKTVTRGKGKKAVTTTDAHNVSFAFTPVLVEDGNYDVMARATDTSGNQATTAVVTIVLDRLPPRFGMSVVTVGPQVMQPGADGVLVLPAGVDLRVTASLVGGPISTVLRARKGQTVANFSLRRSAESGLWVGVLGFRQAGQYQLMGEALDGAGNRTSRTLATIEVVSPVKVEGSAAALKNAVVTLYYLNPEDHAWAVWDGATYGQRNPQPLEGQGNFSLLVPPGTYYLKVAVPGGFDTLTRSFAVDRPTPLTGTIQLGVRMSLQMGPVHVALPWTNLAAPPLRTMKAGSAPAVVGTRLPLVSLPTTAGRTVLPVEWYGKATVVAMVPTWAPTTTEQMAALAQLQANTDVNVIPLAEQQQTETVAAYLRISHRTIEAVADPDGLLSETLAVPATPMLYFIDRHGIIKKVMVGVHSADELLTELSRL